MTSHRCDRFENVPSLPPKGAKCLITTCENRGEHEIMVGFPDPMVYRKPVRAFVCTACQEKFKPVAEMKYSIVPGSQILEPMKMPAEFSISAKITDEL